MAEQIGVRLGARLQELRRAAKLTQAQLAEQLGDGVAVETISRFERGALVPSFAWLERIAACLGVSVADIVIIALGPDPASERDQRLREIHTQLALLDNADLERVSAIIRLYSEGRRVRLVATDTEEP